MTTQPLSNSGDIPPTRREREATLREGALPGVFAHLAPQGYRMVRLLSQEGSEAVLYLVEREGIPYVLKAYHPHITPDPEVVEKVKHLSLTFPNHLVRILQAEYTPQGYYEVLEYLPLGNLRTLMEKGPGDEDVALLVLQDLAEALACIHSAGIIHRDLKPANILIKSQEPLELVLTDFGISSLCPREVLYVFVSRHRTIPYAAPEVLAGAVSPKSDYWSLGMCLYEFLLGRHPLSDLTLQEMELHIATKDITIAETLPPSWQYLLQGLLRRNPEERFGYEEIRDWCATYRKRIRQEPPFSLLSWAEEATTSLSSWERAREDFMSGKVSRRLLEDYRKNSALVRRLDALRTGNPDIALSKALIIALHACEEERCALVFRGVTYLRAHETVKESRLFQVIEQAMALQTSQEEELFISALVEGQLLSFFAQTIGNTSLAQLAAQAEVGAKHETTLAKQAGTFWLFLSGEAKTFLERMQKAMEDTLFLPGEDATQAEAVLSGALPLTYSEYFRLSYFLRTKAVPLEHIAEFMGSERFRTALRQVFKEGKNPDTLLRAVLEGRLLSTYGKRVHLPENEVQRFEKAENYALRYENLREKALVFFVLLCNGWKEIQEELQSRYQNRVILDAELDALREWVLKGACNAL
ncbi:serine/threonine-protein kinase [Candidatus Caldatribacterium sp.]|uniref:serine/threonine-protein kinase n=1 Tax=Candidatus Caldatribacterium sp. TaxID=2282143 RepID=UPI0029930EF5|nr:serine/threonine protein kinase [Candidatus Caldatribacterium sp.]MDW8082101.1 serine/threonine-protein kinase [Candidatus Calescibacterium sp.]